MLWALLPPAVLLAAYAPRAISFAAGQAGFTIVLLILFNIIQPTGWTVGLVRVEDVAVGFAVSLAVGLLFWPRGVGDLLRESLGAAYARSADYVASATRRLVAAGGAGWTETAVQPARQIARAAANRLDDAFRDYLTESSPHQGNLEGLATLVAGTTRVRLAAYSLSTLTPAPAGGPRIDESAEALAAEVAAVRSWYVSLADALVERTAIPPPHPRADDDDRQVLQCVRKALAAGDDSMVGPALSLLWASQHLDKLRELGARLISPAAEFSSQGVHSRHRTPGECSVRIRCDGAPIRFRFQTRAARDVISTTTWASTSEHMIRIAEKAARAPARGAHRADTVPGQSGRWPSRVRATIRGPRAVAFACCERVRPRSGISASPTRRALCRAADCCPSVWKKARETAGVDSLPPYDLRHAFASLQIGTACRFPFCSSAGSWPPRWRRAAPSSPSRPSRLPRPQQLEKILDLIRSGHAVRGRAGGGRACDVRRAHRVANAMRAGTVWINAYRTVSINAPFGGQRGTRSPWGRPSSAVQQPRWQHRVGCVRHLYAG